MRLNKIEGLKPLLPNRKYGQKWEDLEFGISAQSLIEIGEKLRFKILHWNKKTFAGN